MHDREVATAGGGQRVALNLTGIDRDEVDRGQWVVKEPTLEPTYLADVRLVPPSDAPAPLARVLRARVDHGTAEMLAKVVLADRETLLPGRILLRATPFRRAGARLSGRPFHSPFHHASDHAGRRQRDRPGSAQTQRRAGVARLRWRSLNRDRSDALAALLLQESFPQSLARAQARGQPLSLAIHRRVRTRRLSRPPWPTAALCRPAASRRCRGRRARGLPRPRPPGRRAARAPAFSTVPRCFRSSR